MNQAECLKYYELMKKFKKLFFLNSYEGVGRKNGDIL